MKKKKRIAGTGVIALVIMLLTVLSSCAPQPAWPIPETEPVSYTDASVGYLGPEGTYTQEACWVYFDREGEYIPYPTVSDAVEALVDGAVDYAVIPQENTIGGAVIDYVDTLIAQTEVSVVGEVELPINQNLLVLPGTELGRINTVYSHKQGVAQGRDWLNEHLPEAEIVEVSSTAEGARMVAEGKDPSCAAIASAACADVYGLELIAEGIQNNESNKTRFYVLSMAEPSKAQADRLAFIVSGDADDLPDLMSEMEKRGMTLIAIHDRPLKTELGEYYYLIECTGSFKSYEALTKEADFTFRYLGSFSVR
ncbi:MAG: prephenate dehydratase [Clostridia bacterium]|nr:prephenate dehydratase [Clostridia bacterium]